MNDEQSVLTPTPTMNKVPGIGTLAVVGAMALLVGGVSGYTSYPLVNGHSNAELTGTENATTSTLVTSTLDEPIDAPLETAPQSQGATATPTEAAVSTLQSPPAPRPATPPTQPQKIVQDVPAPPAPPTAPAAPAPVKNPFCAEYGTYEVPKDDVPEKYYKEGITSYIKARGNISYNATKPMFGVNAPNSGTGPFTISGDIKTQLSGIKQGDCVEVLYGSRGYDPHKIVLEVKHQ